MESTTTLKVLVLLNTFVLVSSLPTGPPPSACSDMTPQHYGTIPQDHVTSPFSISYLPTYIPGETNTISVSVLSNVPSRTIRGLFLQARRIGDSIPRDSSAIVGTWTLFDGQDTDYQLMKCSNPGDAVTHKKRNADTEVSFLWEAPQDMTDDFQFLVTVVENFTTYWVQLTGPVISSSPVEMDPCAESRCQNNGTCVVNEDSTTTCECARGFAGPICTSEICTTVRCRNGAVCNKVDGVETCTCREGYSGEFCEIEITPCTSNPCMDGGTCTVGESNTFECSCPENREGPRCETPVCPPDTCKNGATCVVGMDTTESGGEVYICQCPPGYTGDRCEQEIDECRSNPCLNGGRCIDEVNRYSCRCLKGFGGKMCQDYCVGDFSCENFGSCQYENKSSSLYCSCLPGYVGERCEIEKDFCREQPCPEGSLCIRKLNGFLCKCTRFSDEDCVDTPEPPDLCSPGNHLCPENDCVPLFNLYFCNCSANVLDTTNCGSVIIPPAITKNFSPTPGKPSAGGSETPWWFIVIGMVGVLVIVFISAMTYAHCSRK